MTKIQKLNDFQSRIDDIMPQYICDNITYPQVMAALRELREFAIDNFQDDDNGLYQSLIDELQDVQDAIHECM